MSILHKQFQTDKNSEENGIWLRYPDPDAPDAPPVEIRVARAGNSNAKYLASLDRETRGDRHRIEKKTMPLAESREVMIRVYADSVVLEWRNVTSADGKPMACTRENVIKLFKELPDFFDDIREQAENADLYRAHLRTADAGN